MSEDELLDEVHRQFTAQADPEFAKNLRWFFRDQEVDPWGVRGAQAAKIEQFVYREIKSWPPAARNRFFTKLLSRGRLEEGSLVAHVYRRFRRDCGRSEFKLFEGWIDRYVHNWAHCDGIASWLVAACIENEPELRYQLPAWTKSKNRWKRRAAAVALLQEAKQGRHTAEILDIAERLKGDPDDMVQKGVGWLLKEAYPKSPNSIAEYMLQWTGPRLVVRYAAEKMKSADRLALGLRA